MATFQAVVSSYKKADGTRNVMICIFHNGQKRYPKTNFFLDKDDLTRSLKIKNQLYIDKINNILKKCRDCCNQYADVIASYNIDKVLHLIEPIISGRDILSNKFELNFIEYGRNFVQKLKKDGRDGNAKTYEITLNNLVKFIGSEYIDINEITTNFIKQWIDWLQNISKGKRVQSLYPSNVRALHNRAKDEFNDEDIGLIQIPLSPFKKIKLPPLPEIRERALNIKQIRQIFNLQNSENYKSGKYYYNFACDLFMLSFMLVGINEVDLYNCTDFSNGRITYYRTKVKNRRSDKGKISIKIEPEALPLIEKYKDKTGERVFCFYQIYNSVNVFCRSINGNIIHNTGLKKIGKELGIENLQFYAARHSWATIARNDCGIDKYTIHESLNHVVDIMKITDTYIKKDWSNIDRANRKVLDYIFGKE
ncbi:MAG: site-specific integrase [Paludibacter sp.]|nr:site-specific integrase [Paludibacter sp.]